MPFYQRPTPAEAREEFSFIRNRAFLTPEKINVYYFFVSPWFKMDAGIRMLSLDPIPWWEDDAEVSQLKHHVAIYTNGSLKPYFDIIEDMDVRNRWTYAPFPLEYFEDIDDSDNDFVHFYFTDIGDSVYFKLKALEYDICAV